MWSRIGRVEWALVVVLALAGCAGQQVFREGRGLAAEGKPEAALAKMGEAVRLEPTNAEYRIALATLRTSTVNELLHKAEAARRDARFSDAEKIYTRVLALEPDNEAATRGVATLVRDRRHQQWMADAEPLLKTPAGQAEALERVRQVLLENPQQRQAQYLKARIDEEQRKAARPEARLGEAYRRPVSLEFRDAPLKSILEVIAKVAELNFFYDRDVRPDLRATVVAKKTTVEDALRLLLVTNQLEFKVLNDNSLLIYQNTPQKLKEYQELAVRSFFLANADAKAVGNTLKSIVKTRDLVVDERLNVIVMRDTPEAVRLAERIVALQDLGDAEVMLEVEILEVKRSRLLELGIQWPGQLSLTPLVADGAALTLSQLSDLRANNIRATVGSVVANARKEDQDGNILANPRIRVRNKDKAKIQIGDRVPVITTTSTSTGFVSESVNYVDVGLKLEVEPNIHLDQEVAIKVNLEVSNLVREIVSKSGTLSYQIGQRAANTVLQLRDGETQVLAGLISNEDRVTASKVPALGDLPIAGRLFGSGKTDGQRSEILLSITPHILRSVQRPDLLAAEIDSGTEGSVGAPALRLSAAPEPAASAAMQTPVPRTAVVAAPKALALSWSGPVQVKAGEQFSVALKLGTDSALKGAPVLIGFDPQILQVVSVAEGDYFRQAGGRSTFTHRIDAAQGRVFAAGVREGEAGINGTGAILTLVVRALKPAPAAAITLLSATPEPAASLATALPLQHSVKIEP
ncbi:secretin N-terminal domain-containing protein [Roseateles cellulosilyticus]|uniref:General secretion pathway protein GspD n=1 Tax=Pelomonas cellulosilytica TaxID=2906762 RepID=A0ABS8XNC1_9BURK|nr:secretin N-terminal domain-containing protein [Pelomonas sp. P8]MCE4554274.1 general secretion pathway protein GspD [Pelomonas sp. P8]